MAEWRKLTRKGKTFYYNTKTKTSKWTKPAEMEEYEKEQEEKKKNEVWIVRKDRFGRQSYYNKKTKESTLSKPFELWTEEEKQAKRKKDAEILAAEKARKKAEREAKRRKKGPKAKALLLIYEKIQKPDPGGSASDALEKVKLFKKLRSQSSLLPCPGLVFGSLVEHYKSRDGSDVKDYDSRRIAAQVEKKNGSTDFYEVLRAATLGLGQPLRHPIQYLPSRVLHTVTLYCRDDFYLHENYVAIPTNPAHEQYPLWYGKEKCLGDDLKSIGWDARRVPLEDCLKQQEARQKVLEAADASKEPICTDEQWIKFWGEKFKLKEEMNLLRRRKKLGF